MSNTFLETPIEYLKGVGPKRAESLKRELNIFTFEDLLTFYPFRYVDRSIFHKIININLTLPYVQIKGRISALETVGMGKGMRLVARFEDDTGAIELVWFKGIKWIKPSLKSNVEYIVFGKPTLFNRKINIAHPEIEPVDGQSATPELGVLQPVYSSTEKLGSKGLISKGITRLQKTLLRKIEAENINPLHEILSTEIINKYKFLSRAAAIGNIHSPQSQELLLKAQFRLKFEEFFFIQLKLLSLKIIRYKKLKGFVFSKVGTHFNSFYNEALPFELTNAQKRVIKEIRKDIGAGRQMNRLLQGDVGSGKTIVALMAMLIALDNGFQACIMAPTEILANQHIVTIRGMLNKLGINVGLLTGSTKAAERRKLHEQLESGELKILVGTHALIEEKVKFKTLGLVVIDEQHRFGVAQRARLWKKSEIHLPHVLVMTATPIPRTLAMTLYGDLDISVIDELPPGRKPVKTFQRYDSSRLRVFGFIKQQIKLGRQVYVVYPLIKESEKMDYKDLMDGYESIVREFPLPDYNISIVHGQMKSDVKDFEMQRFVKGQTQIMVATNVIEVGVDVPNASVMIIESAERFGLSQLHQMRGRIGRGADQSYCILMTGEKLSESGRMRMQTMVRTTDGFEIAEVDMKIRGPGDIEGTRQSGILDLKIADLVKDGQILQSARNIAIKLLEHDPDLQLPENIPVARHLADLKKDRKDWSRIS
ncbi:MAG: ATP-dependent DNA helicase RecG [Bacteroidota bacterium]